MDSPPIQIEEERSDTAKRKGKWRAAADESDETTPLLGPSAQLIRDEGPPPLADRRSRGRLFVLLSTVFLSTLCAGILLILVLIVIAWWGYGSKISNVRDDVLLDRAVVFRGPDRVDVLNATEAGTIWLQIDGRVGVDAGEALDTILDVEDAENLGFGLTMIRRTMARWAVQKMRELTVSVEGLSVLFGEATLVNVSAPAVSLPLTLDPPSDEPWLTKLSLPVCVNITQDADVLEAFVKQSWRTGVVRVVALSPIVTVHGGLEGETSWRRLLNVTQEDVKIPLKYRIPDLPGLPQPGKNAPFPELADLVTLESFNITTSNHTISVCANASIIDPLPDSANITIPSIPFTVWLNNTGISGIPPLLPVSTGHALPFSSTHPNISLTLLGNIPPLPRRAAPLLSSFVSAYLSGHVAPIVVGSPLLLPSVKIPTVFPAPHPKPQILHDVQIKDMRISLKGEQVLASGTVYARVVLPMDIELKLEADSIWPDVLVFDGEVPDEDLSAPSSSPIFTPTATTDINADTSNSPQKNRTHIPKPPLPTPLPPRAFARIRPTSWLPAVSYPIDPNPSSGSANQYEVSSLVEDVPLEVLPGRDRLLQRFVAKVLFGPEGALAGVRGTAAVAAAVDGLPVDDDGDDGEERHVVELTGLPFTGSFRVGKKTL